MLLVRCVSAAMEHYRKGRVSNYMDSMVHGVRVAFAVAKFDGIDLLDIIRQKRDFNATREDHKIANRLKAGGKAF